MEVANLPTFIKWASRVCQHWGGHGRLPPPPKYATGACTARMHKTSQRDEMARDPRPFRPRPRRDLRHTVLRPRRWAFCPRQDDSTSQDGLVKTKPTSLPTGTYHMPSSYDRTVDLCTVLATGRCAPRLSPIGVRPLYLISLGNSLSQNWSSRVKQRNHRAGCPTLGYQNFQLANFAQKAQKIT